MKLQNLIPCLLLLLLSAGASAQDKPLLTQDEEFILDLPTIDFEGISGYYQNARFAYLPEQDLWKLQRVQKGFPLSSFESVELIKTDTIPVQAFIKIEGYIGACSEHGPISVSTIGDTFKVNLYYDYDAVIASASKTCIAAVYPYTKIVALPVYGLNAGEYEYSVNGIATGSFELSEDNVLE